MSPTFTATVEQECPECGLSIHVGDDVVLGQFAWLHVLCGETEDSRLQSIVEERAVDYAREDRCP